MGGLSVLRELQHALPDESFLYYADSGYCPYGGKSAAEIQTRAVAITDALLERGAKLIVVACNTATIAAIEYLRAHYAVSFVGMEPAIKPAVQQTRSGVVGVLATGAALAGDKFLHLVQRHARDVRVLTQPCPGLVECVEQGDVSSPKLHALVGRYVQPLIDQGADTLVLGCTHYPFLRPVIQQAAGSEVMLLDTGAAVARQARRLLEREGLLAAPRAGAVHEAWGFRWLSSADPAVVGPVIEHLLPGGQAATAAPRPGVH